MTNYDTALAAVRRCARRLEKTGIPMETIAEALFAEGAGRLAAVTQETEAVQHLAGLWWAIGLAAEIKRGAHDGDK